MAAADPRTPAPWRFFAAHQPGPFGFFIDRGAEGGPSFAGSHPREQLVIDAAGCVRHFAGGQWRSVAGDPTDCVADFVESCRAPAAAVPAWLDGAALPRTVGFLAYELGRWMDGPKNGAHDGLRRAVGTPLAVLSTYDTVDAWDPQSARSARIRFAGAARCGGPPPLPAPDAAAWSATSREAYDRGFARIRDAIAAGEIYQANLSRRCVFDAGEDAADVYSRLRELQPVSWGAFLDFGGFALLSNSPECFLVRRADFVATRPIKGTRARSGAGPDDDDARSDLRADPKEMAEHLMIVDLERNDLGRVARTGSVEVSRFAEVESFSTLHHMVSEVRALLRPATGLAALLRATFPGGSITGAPKIRAMEVLAGVEGDERGPYTGAIGFFNGQDQLELSIAIRTAVAAGGRLLYSCGGGIVADSDAGREWQETEVKTAALRRVLAGEARPGNNPGARDKTEMLSMKAG